jgi:ribosomal-protein-alanine N-acetyltransferase
MNELGLSTRALEPEDAAALLAFREANRDYFRPSEPLREDSWFTLAAQREQLEVEREARERGQAIVLGVFADGALIGRVALTGIARGPFMNAYLGYAVDRAHTGKGVGSAAVATAVRHAWNDGLHRVQAAVVPTNLGSKRLLQKTLFWTVPLHHWSRTTAGQ